MTGKNIIITGGARDIGRAVCLKFASAGANVCFNYHSNQEQAEAVLEEIKAHGVKAIAVQGDMTKTADVENLVSAATAAFGNEIHVLVNVAGGLLARKNLAEIEEHFYDDVMNVNLKTAFLVSQKVAPLMPENSAIVNFSSQAARDGGGPGAMLYSAAKGAVLTLTKGMAKELGPKGIRVNCVSPGMISTGFHDTFTKPEVRKNVAAATPLRREGKAEEVADLVYYLASDNASFINGASIEINGGSYFV